MTYRPEHGLYLDLLTKVQCLISKIMALQISFYCSSIIIRSSSASRIYTLLLNKENLLYSRCKITSHSRHHLKKKKIGCLMLRLKIRNELHLKLYCKMLVSTSKSPTPACRNLTLSMSQTQLWLIFLCFEYQFQEQGMQKQHLKRLVNSVEVDYWNSCLCFGTISKHDLFCTCRYIS